VLETVQPADWRSPFADGVMVGAGIFTIYDFGFAISDLESGSINCCDLDEERDSPLRFPHPYPLPRWRGTASTAAGNLIARRAMYALLV